MSSLRSLWHVQEDLNGADWQDGPRIDGRWCGPLDHMVSQRPVQNRVGWRLAVGLYMMTLYLLLSMGMIVAHDGNNDVEILSTKLTWPLLACALTETPSIYDWWSSGVYRWDVAKTQVRCTRGQSPVLVLMMSWLVLWLNHKHHPMMGHDGWYFRRHPMVMWWLLVGFYMAVAQTHELNFYALETCHKSYYVEPPLDS